MFKLLLILLSIFVIFFIPSSVLAAGASLTLVPNTNTYNRSCGFSIGIDMNTGGNPTDGTDVKLKFDPSVIKATSIDQGSVYSTYPDKSYDNTNGTISISGLASVESPFNGSGRFATVNFQVEPSAVTGLTQVKFDFVRGSSTDSNVVQSNLVIDILESVTDGTYTIGIGSCAGTGGTTPTPTPLAVVDDHPNAFTGGTTGGTTTKGGISTGSGQTLDNIVGGSPGISSTTLAVSIIGSVLVIAGILGLAFL